MDKDEYYLDIAEVVSQKSTCLRKKWGAIIVQDNVIVSTGFNGAPRKMEDCTQRGYCHLVQCRKETSRDQRGTMYEECYSVHAEQNAIIFGNLDRMKNSTLYLVGKQTNGLDEGWIYVDNPTPCKLCRKMIINAGINKVVTRLDKNIIKTIEISEWIEKPYEIIGKY